MNFVHVERQALELSMQERAKLAHRLLESLDEVSAAEAERLWLEAATRRVEEIDQGAVRLVSADELEGRVQALLK